MRMGTIGTGFLALGVLALAACAGSGEKIDSGSRLVQPQTPEVGAAAAVAATGSSETQRKTQEAAAAVSAAAAEKAAVVKAAPVEVMKKTEERVAAASASAVEATTRAVQVADNLVAAPAKPGESVVRFDNDKLREEGPVEFSHPKHKEAFGQEKLDCKPCHIQPPPLFKMKKRAAGEARYTMDDMKQGKACGKCHDGKSSINGKTPFSVSSEDDCGKCHKK